MNQLFRVKPSLELVDDILCLFGVTNFNENYKFTRDDIKRYVDTYIIGKPSVTGVLLSPAMKEDMQIDDLESYLKN